MTNLTSVFLKSVRATLTIGSLFGVAGFLLAAEDDETIEEVVVVGTQIKGAKIAGALPVSVITAEDIEAFGVDAGDELLENISENGMNLFNEAENASGGVNSSRGDVGAGRVRGHLHRDCRRRDSGRVHETGCSRQDSSRGDRKSTRLNSSHC